MPSTDMPSTDMLVPDLLQPGLTLVIVGSAPSRVSARAGAYYANPGNRFWRTLAEVGLTERQLAPHEYPLLLALGIGLTDVAKWHAGTDAQLPVGAWQPELLLARLQAAAPQLVAFSSKRAAAEAVGLGSRTAALAYGRQTEGLAGAEAWVLPSTSPLARSHFALEPWLALGRRYRELHAERREPIQSGQGAPP